MKAPTIAMTSNSCPANLTIKRELSAVGSSQTYDFAQSLDLCDGIPGFSDGMSGLGDLGGLDVQGRRGELGFLMMDEPLSPMGGDPLLSAMSPEASVDSSRRSSFSIEDGDIM
ncbi:hypothetical protein XENOCAPTIV_030666 [Xenoophorus captivus]|uniref:MiT/TFE transcription factors C-terminal domain-containing protein n=1 Tax=Xenoophorus captivus TaxID=1517983 RepID=A0ABV0REF4_9TELE